MVESHKIRIKIGDAEFEAEGAEEAVKAQFEAFMAAVAACPSNSRNVPKQETDGAGADEVPMTDESRQELLNKAFVVGKDVVSLKFLPKTETAHPDTLILLLYGYRKLRGEDAVLSTQLLNAARVSGLKLERIDRTIAKHENLLLSGGARKGTKHGLNNQGLIYAENLLRKQLM
jgi:hypothetical protein